MGAILPGTFFLEIPAGVACLLALVWLTALTRSTANTETRRAARGAGLVLVGCAGWSALTVGEFLRTGQSPVDPPWPAVWYAWIFVGGLAAVVKVTERWDTSRRDRRLELALGASVLAWVLSACNACGATAAV